MNEKFINVNNSNIYYTTTGKGDAVVLLHGFAEDSSIWNTQTAFLKNNFLLIIPDLPGSGQSSLLQKENAGIEDYAHCIQLILQQENITQCTMIGHSMGGYITLAFAEKYPGLLKGLGLFHSSAYADDDEKISTRKKGVLFIETYGAEAFLKTSLPGLFHDVQKSQHQIGQLLTKGKTFTSRALIQYYHAMIARPDRTQVLKNFAGPVLFMMGLHDKAVPYQHSLQQSYLPHQSYIYVLRNSTHMGMLEEKDKVNECLLFFLQNI